jgi:AraC-like DNA-binding protein
MHSMDFVVHPSVAAHGHVAEYWEFSADLAGEWHGGLPKPYVELVFNLGGPFDWRAQTDGPLHLFEAGWITPLQRGPRQARAHGRFNLMGARLYPVSALALFGPLPAGDGTPPLRFESMADRGDGWAMRLRMTLLECASAAERFEAIDHALAARAIEHGLDLADTSAKMASTTTVSALSDEARLSPRRFRERFGDRYGIAPKMWLRLTRLEQILRDPELCDPASSLAQLACRHHFFDQAHLNREFRLLAGVTPGQLRQAAATAQARPPHLVADL